MMSWYNTSARTALHAKLAKWVEAQLSTEEDEVKEKEE
jgi:hypothetical protein